MLGCVCPAQRIAPGLPTCSCVWCVLCEGTHVRFQRKNKETKIVEEEKTEIICALSPSIGSRRSCFIFLKEAIAQAHKLLKLGHMFDLQFDC